MLFKMWAPYLCAPVHSGGTIPGPIRSFDLVEIDPTGCCPGRWKKAARFCFFYCCTFAVSNF